MLVVLLVLACVANAVSWKLIKLDEDVSKDASQRIFNSKREGCARDRDGEVTVAQQCLGAHNYFRCLHDSPPLQYDVELQRSAVRYAIKLGGSGIPGDLSMKHSVRGVDRDHNVGENLAWRYEPNNKYNTSQAIADWYSEVMQYDFDKPGYSASTGHFTQLVWKETVSVGCATARVGDELYVIAHYKVKGNKLKGFADNVLRLNSAVCQARCKMGSCHGHDGPSSFCHCGNRKSQAQPQCTGSCVAYCPKPKGFVGYWHERCEGNRYCTCSSMKNDDRGNVTWPGAKCV